MKNDPRIRRLNSALTDAANFNFGSFRNIKRSDSYDGIDSVIYAAFLMGEQLQEATSRLAARYFELFLEGYPDLAFLLNDDLFITKVNGNACDRLGHSAERLIGTRFPALLGVDPLGSPVNPGRLLIEGGPVRVLFSTLYHRLGYSVEMELRIIPIPRDEDVPGILVLARETSVQAVEKWLRHCAGATLDNGQGEKLQSAAQRLAERPVTNPAIARHGLTERDLHIIRYISQGLTSKEIAKRFGTSPKTVATQRDRLFAKMGVFKDTALVQLANDLGLIGMYRW